MSSKNNRSDNDKRERSIKRKITADISKLTEDWKRLQKHHSLSENVPFLQKMASELLQLYENSRALDEDSMSEVDHLLTTPIQQVTLLDSILSFPYQDPMHSDLCVFLHDFTTASLASENEWISLFWDID
ncbi:MAG: hypothetical protein WCP39_05090 [Chlamydiota bacterium]